MEVALGLAAASQPIGGAPRPGPPFPPVPVSLPSERPPSLWLRCGRCARQPNLATVTPAWWHGSARLANADPLPGDHYILRERPGVDYRIHPGPGGAGFVHVLTCNRCPPTEGPASRVFEIPGRRIVATAPAPAGFRHRITQERLSRMWSEFIATGRPRDVVRLYPDR